MTANNPSDIGSQYFVVQIPGRKKEMYETPKSKVDEFLFIANTALQRRHRKWAFILVNTPNGTG